MYPPMIQDGQLKKKNKTPLFGMGDFEARHVSGEYVFFPGIETCYHLPTQSHTPTHTDMYMYIYVYTVYMCIYIYILYVYKKNK